jgi:hypothetical protein
MLQKRTSQKVGKIQRTSLQLTGITMELDVTPLFADKLESWTISNSVANLGDNAGQITWRNALAAAEEYPLATEDNQEELRSYFKSFGAWEASEIYDWTLQVLSAVCWQMAAADCNENWIDLEELPEESPEDSQIYQHEGKFFMYFGS